MSQAALHVSGQRKKSLFGDLCFVAFIGLLLITVEGQPQAVENGWKGILPLVSSRTDVEKAYGKHERVDDNGYYNYRTGDFFVQVNYATGPCHPNRYNRGKFNVPEGTVLDLWVHLKKTILLSDLNFNRDAYFRSTGGDVEGVVYYQSRDPKIFITTSILDDGQTEEVGRIIYGPSEKSAMKFTCPR